VVSEILTIVDAAIGGLLMKGARYQKNLVEAIMTKFSLPNKIDFVRSLTNNEVDLRY